MVVQEIVVQVQLQVPGGGGNPVDPIIHKFKDIRVVIVHQSMVVQRWWWWWKQVGEGAPDDPATPNDKKFRWIWITKHFWTSCSPQPMGAPGPGSGRWNRILLWWWWRWWFLMDILVVLVVMVEVDELVELTGDGVPGTFATGRWRWIPWSIPNMMVDGKRGGNGGSGVVMVRYKIGSIRSSRSCKITGGIISYYNNKTIHTFTWYWYI